MLVLVRRPHRQCRGLRPADTGALGRPSTGVLHCCANHLDADQCAALPFGHSVGGLAHLPCFTTADHLRVHCEQARPDERRWRRLERQVQLRRCQRHDAQAHQDTSSLDGLDRLLEVRPKAPPRAGQREDRGPADREPPGHRARGRERGAGRSRRQHACFVVLSAWREWWRRRRQERRGGGAIGLERCRCDFHVAATAQERERRAPVERTFRAHSRGASSGCWLRRRCREAAIVPGGGKHIQNLLKGHIEGFVT
mmetsp:Transcript_31691/g.91288  ORF Transcript_31691/g.91288 Transcript_31691/m.91288 type:complete len:254 (-) Transcript_31691:290-1051(-)